MYSGFLQLYFQIILHFFLSQKIAVECPHIISAMLYGEKRILPGALVSLSR